MNAKSTIRKILFITVWVCIGGGMLTLLLAAIGKKNKGECSDYAITLKATGNNFFIDENDVKQLLVNATGGKIKGQPVSSFNLHELGQMLEHNSWINDAVLYFDNRNVLHITVTEKQPVGRIFTKAGNSFYIDAAGKKMPLSAKLSAKVPVFTSFPDTRRLSGKDSALLEDVTTTAGFIFNDPFWMSQVAQVDISDKGTFEMIPVVGNHIVKLGDGDNIDQKFRRLFIFYQQVLGKTGFDKYKMIDVQYRGQVVASKQAGNIKIDPVQYRKNVEKLIAESNEVVVEPGIKTAPVTGRYDLQADSATAPAPELKEIEINRPVKQADNKASNPNPLKSSLPSKTGAGKETKPVEKMKTPKAVMPKKETREEENGGYY